LSFFNITGVPFDFECLKIDERELREAAIVGKLFISKCVRQSKSRITAQRFMTSDIFLFIQVFLSCMD
jgi:hypothetical protein